MFSTASLPANPDLTQRLIDQQCTVQWRGFLQALAAEFAAALPPEDLRALMFRVGVRFAAEHPLPACATLDDLQSSMAAVWDRIGWGGVRLQQTAAHRAPATRPWNKLHAQSSAAGAERVGLLVCFFVC